MVHTCGHVQQLQCPQQTSEGQDDEEKPREPPVELPVVIKDHGNGTYLVTYTAPCPGKVSVAVMLDAQDGMPPQNIRGSPFTATFVEKARPRANEFAGPTVTNFVASTINILEKFCLRTEAGLQASHTQLLGWHQEALGPVHQRAVTASSLASPRGEYEGWLM